MTRAFPQTMDFGGFNAPSRIEADIYDLIVEGEIPEEIEGRWYRATPDHQYPPSYEEDTYISGDGMISMFRIEDGHVDYKSRYVMTERLKNDRKARRSLYGRYRNPYTDDESVRLKPGRSAANTTPVFHAGHLLATKEDGRPIALDPDTLETIGEYDFGGKLRSDTVTAHVRIDYDTGYMYLYGYEAGGLATDDVAYCVVDPDGNLVREQWFKAPYAGLVHDFAVTKTHAIFPFFPLKTDLERLKGGGAHWVWDFDDETVMGIMARDGDVADMRWFRGPPAMSFHFMNAFDEGDKVHLDFGVSEMSPFPFMQRDSGIEPGPPGPPNTRTGVARWTFDLKGQANTWSERIIAPPGDMPAVADKDHMKPYEIGYYQSFEPRFGPPLVAGPVGVGFNIINRLNVQTGEIRQYCAGPGTTVQEHVHIASKQPGHEGWLLFIVDQHESHHTEAHLIEAEHPEKGPVARIHIPYRLRTQVHGSWVPETEDEEELMDDIRAELDALKREVRMLRDVHEVRTLHFKYGYYIDMCLYDEAVDLFADDGVVYFLNGIYRGKELVARVYKGWFRDMFTQGVNGPVYGFLLDHFISQDIVDISDDGTTAYGRFRCLMQAGSHETKEPKVRPMPDQCWEAGIHENTYVKDQGVWKIKALNYNMLWQADYDSGWAHSSVHLPPLTRTFPEDPHGPDELFGETPNFWPHTRVVPFHYPHPVTGARWK